MDVLNRDWENPYLGKKQACGTATAVLSLALTAILSTFLVVVIGYYYASDKGIMRPIAQGVAAFDFIACWIPIAVFRIRRVSLVRYTVFFSIMGTWVGLIWLFSDLTVVHLFFEALSEFEIEAIVAVCSIILLSIMISEAAVLRTKYPYSEKSGRWLHSYSVAGKFTIDETTKPFEALTFDDIMESDRIIRNQPPCRLILFLDCIPDGRHLLGIVMRIKVSFFSLSLFKNKVKRRTFPITREQAERIAEKFCPVKRMFFNSIWIMND